MNGQIMNSQTITKQTRARPNKTTAESTGNISAMQRNQNIYNDVSAISSPVRSFEKVASGVHVRRE